ncbi:MAG: putative toxin-antitoxin system toxin component, PIN family [Lachnospiraceae bacterium]|nr:putative toxin-antitoxin system toxin component, PIN family [Lachnospiraceae bacterium]
MKCYAVIDTNVIVSGLLTNNRMAPTAVILDAMMDGKIIPLFHEDILAEYEDVLQRKKFPFDQKDIEIVIHAVKEFGLEVFPEKTGEIFIDVDDLIFYEVAMEKRSDDAYLVTGNRKHYPIKDFIVTPAEMVEILRQYGNTD